MITTFPAADAKEKSFPSNNLALNSGAGRPSSAAKQDRQIQSKKNLNQASVIKMNISRPKMQCTQVLTVPQEGFDKPATEQMNNILILNPWEQ